MMKPNTDTLSQPGPGAVVEHATNGTGHQLHELLAALQAVRVGDFSVRMSGDRLGIEGKIADTFNEIVAANQRMAQQLERVGQRVGKEGKTRQRVKFGLASGSLAGNGGLSKSVIGQFPLPTAQRARGRPGRG